MDKAEQYRRDAAAAVKLAETAADLHDKALMLKIAQGWLDLAHQSEAGHRPFKGPRRPGRADRTAGVGPALRLDEPGR